MRFDLGLSLLRRKVLDLPTEQAIDFARLALVLTCVAAIRISPPPQAGAQEALSIVLAFYVLFACTLILVSRARWRQEVAVVEQGIDIAVTGALIFFTEGSTSAFFSLFTFNLIVGLLRWNWRGALTTAAVTASSLLVLPAQFTVTPTGLSLVDADLSRAIVRGGFLVVCGAMLAYLGAHRERTRRRFAQLAAWPVARDTDEAEAPSPAALGHVAMMMQAGRVLVVWDETEALARKTCHWDQGRITREDHAPDRFGDIVSRGTPLFTSWREGDDPDFLDPDLRDRFAMRAGLAVGFERVDCAGRVFILDRWTWSEEDAPAAELIAERIGIEIEAQAVRRQLDEVLVSKERMRLGRDLHDGLLQDLAAANIHLKLLSDRVPPEARDKVGAVREILAGGNHRIREFVEETRAAPVAPDSEVAIAAQLRRRAGFLNTQWSCEVEVAVEPVDLRLSLPTLRQLEHLMSEGTSNAVRHGGAAGVVIQVTAMPDGVRLRIQDDGRGFAATRGPEGGEVGKPLSLTARVEEMGGRLAVADEGLGGDLTIDLPARPGAGTRPG